MPECWPRNADSCLVLPKEYVYMTMPGGGEDCLTAPVCAVCVMTLAGTLSPLPRPTLQGLLSEVAASLPASLHNTLA